jgi:hypothetical protein
MILLISASWVARITDVSYQHPAWSGYFEDGVSWTICLGWPWTVILPISASQVAKITGVSHLCLIRTWVFAQAHLEPLILLSCWDYSSESLFLTLSLFLLSHWQMANVTFLTLHSNLFLSEFDLFYLYIYAFIQFCMPRAWWARALPLEPELHPFT